MSECWELTEEAAQALNVIGFIAAIGFVAAVAAILGWSFGRASRADEIGEQLDYIEAERARIARHNRRCRRDY